MRRLLRLSLPVAAVLGVGVVSGCGPEQPPVAVPAIGETAAKAGATVSGLSEDRNNSDMLRLDDGTYIVGEDIWPGTYRSAGAVDSAFPFCFWSTNKGASTNSEVIDIGSAGVGEQQVVKIGKGVGAFDTSGCEPWEKIG